MSQQQQQPPITVDEALRLFNEVSHLTVRDAQDNERFAESKTTTSSSANNNTRSSKQTSNNNTRTPSSTSRNTPRGVEADLRRQLELSEAVMKKLHAKNKVLTQEIEDLKRNGGSGKGNNNSARNNSNSSNAMSAAEVAELDSLRKRVIEQDAQIKQLMKQQQQQNNNNSRPSSAHGKPPLANSNTNNNENASSSASSSSVRLLEKRIVQMQQQYDALVEVKLECIREGESTGKVNKEVKSFFVSSRQKMMDDAAFHEAERVLLNERIGKLESELIKIQQQQQRK